jgi:hypothetical protein
LNDLILGCGDFNLTGVTWVCRALCPSNVTATRESIIVDGMANCDMGQVTSIPNQYVVYLDLIFFNNPSMSGLPEHCKFIYWVFLKRIRAGRLDPG